MDDVAGDLTGPRLEAVVARTADGRRLAVRSRATGPTRRIHDVGWIDGEGTTWRDGDADERAPVLVDGAVWLLRTAPPGEGPPPTARLVCVAADGTETEVFAWPTGVRRFRIRGERVWVEVDRLPGVPLARQAAAHEARREAGVTVRVYDGLPIRDWSRWCGPGEAVILRVEPGAAPRLAWAPATGERLTGWDVSPDGRVLAAAARRRGGDGQDHDRVAWVGPRQAVVPLPDHTTVDHLHFSPDGRLGMVVHTRPADGFGEPQVAVGGPEGLDVRPGRARWPRLVGWCGDATLTIEQTDGESVLCRGGAQVASGITQAAPTLDGWVGVRSGLGRPPAPAGSGERPAARGFAVTRERWGIGQVQSWCATPARPNGRTLLWIHGGPLSQWSDTWHPRWNPLPFVSLGYTVILPNPSGSVGVATAFTDAVGGNRWGAAVDDVCETLDALVAAGRVDPTNVAVMGGSFGGWASAWLAGRTDRFRCAVVHAGLARMTAMHGISDVPGFLERHLGGGPDDRDDFERWSPVRLADRWRTPTLITHGERDYRVPVGEAICLHHALARRGVDVSLRVYPEAHHWLERPADVEDWHRAVLAFLDRNMA